MTFALLSTIQILLVGVPTLLAVHQSPVAYALIVTLMVFVIQAIFIVSMFFPKFFKVFNRLMEGDNLRYSLTEGETSNLKIERNNTTGEDGLLTCDISSIDIGISTIYLSFYFLL